MRGSAIRARAKESSWRWPWERVLAPLLHLRVVAEGERLHEVVQIDRLRGADHLLVGRVQSPVADVVPDAPGEEEGVLQDEPHLARGGSPW